MMYKVRAILGAKTAGNFTFKFPKMSFFLKEKSHVLKNAGLYFQKWAFSE